MRDWPADRCVLSREGWPERLSWPLAGTAILLLSALAWLAPLLLVCALLN
jgi:hypothetical protein